MEDTSWPTALPDDVQELKRLITEQQATIARQTQVLAELTQQRDTFYLEKLRLTLELAKALKRLYGPRADHLRDPGQLLLDFGQVLDGLPVDVADLPPEPEGPPQPGHASRRLRTRGRRDLGQLEHLPLVEQTYELADELCRCPTCQSQRQKIGEAISYTIEYLPGRFVRIKHIQHKYACPQCEQNGHNPNITLAAKSGGSPIDKGLPGPGLLAYVVTAKFADYLPLHRLQHIFERQGFELDRSTMCLWLAAGRSCCGCCTGGWCSACWNLTCWPRTTRLCRCCNRARPGRRGCGFTRGMSQPPITSSTSPSVGHEMVRRSS